MSLFFEYFKLNLKELLAYRLSLILFLFISILEVLFYAIPFFLIYSATKGFPGWNFYELMFFSVATLFISCLMYFLPINLGFKISEEIHEGNFDFYLLNPAHIFYQMVSKSLRMQNIFPDIIFYSILLIIIFPYTGTAFSWINLFYFIISIFFSGILFLGISLIFAALSFFILDIENVIELFFSFRDVADRPIDVYKNKIIIYLLTFVFPFAFLNFYPASILLGKIDYSIMPFLIILSIFFFAAGYISFKIGLKHYKSPG